MTKRPDHEPARRAQGAWPADDAGAAQPAQAAGGMPAAHGAREAQAAQARAWLRTLVSGDVRPRDAEAFKRWLHASPGHQAAFREARQRWEALGAGVGELLRIDPEAARFHDQAMRGLRPGRRALLGAAAGAAAAAGVAVFYPPAGLWPAPREWTADFRTATGEQRTVTLAAEVSVTLNTRTSIRRQSGADAWAGIELLAGEAAIDLPADGRRFGVTAGSGRSVAQTGRFEVRYLYGKVCVTCLAGQVRVEHPAGARELQPLQQLVYDQGGMSGLAAVDPAGASAWRRGELVFDRARLADVIAEINRYRPGRVVLANDAVRGRPVSGRFQIASLDSALHQLQHTFDLQARLLPAGLLILS